ncbi:MAG: glycosyltransferase family 4 protein [Desulfurococcaceae archaeon]|nr:glycosyltransferase family 4 protein [Desulfurococcaceae archaeon]
MRVALVSSGLIPIPPTRGGAVEEYVYQLSRHLRRLGIDAVVIDANYDSSRVVYEDVNGAQTVRVPTAKPSAGFKERILKELLFGSTTANYINRRGFDVVHANTAWVGFTLALRRNAGKLKSQGFVYTCHNGLWPEDRVHMGEKIVRLVEGYTMKIADTVIALNKTMEKALAEKAKVDPRKMVIVPNGVDTEFFRPGLKNEQILSKYGLEEQSYILFVGRVSPEKGVHILLQAFKQIVNDIPKDFKLVIAGPLTSTFNSAEISGYAKAVMSYTKEKLSERAVFTGEIDKNSLRILYSNACCFVLPSLAEAFGMVLLEAMASGTPPVGSTAGGIPDIIIDGINGLLFRKGDWRDLANKLLTLVQDRGFRDKLSHNARKYVEENFSWGTVAVRIKEVYSSII